MLTYLSISNFAILDEVELSFGPGMTVLTGETGAGKSLILDAVSLLRGGRARADLVRNGAEEARIEAVFSPVVGSESERALLERLEKIGIEPRGVSEDGLIVRRVIGKSGKGRVHIAGQLSTVQALGEVCGGLIDIAGQHEHQSLLEVAQHLRLLDRTGVPAELLAQMATAYERLVAAVAGLQAVSLDEKARAEREEFVRFQLEELASVDPKPGEDESLRTEQKRLRSVTKLHQAARRGEESLYSSEGAVLERLGTLRRELQELGGTDEAMAGFATQVGDAMAQLEDAAHGLRHYADGLSADPERLIEIEERLHLLGRLLRKHGPDLASLFQRRDALAAELERLTASEVHQAAAQKEVEAARKTAAKLASELSAARQAIGETLGTQVSAALTELAMSGAELFVDLQPRLAQKGDEPAFLFPVTSASASPSGDGSEGGRLRRLSKDGWDRCELLLRSNAGEEARPLVRIASGGELSRVMLGLRRVLGQADSISTCVFDEVDAGIGGATADRVGRQIRGLADGKQVLCITHLAQIAAYAHHHLRVEKQLAQGRTVTRVRALSLAERREELARMLGGSRVTAKSRAHAEELLRDAR